MSLDLAYSYEDIEDLELDIKRAYILDAFGDKVIPTQDNKVDLIRKYAADLELIFPMFEIPEQDFQVGFSSYAGETRGLKLKPFQKKISVHVRGNHPDIYLIDTMKIDYLVYNKRPSIDIILGFSENTGKHYIFPIKMFHYDFVNGPIFMKMSEVNFYDLEFIDSFRNFFSNFIK